MELRLRPSKGWRLREEPFSFQQTYITPLADLSRFVKVLLEPFELIEAEVWIETIVFTPNELLEYLESFGIKTCEGDLNRSIIRASNAAEAKALVECVLGEWIDFSVFPSPNHFNLYADHDEYATIFVPSIEMLASLRTKMKLEGFKEVDDWLWTGPKSEGKIEDGIDA